MRPRRPAVIPVDYLSPPPWRRREPIALLDNVHTPGYVTDRAGDRGGQ